MIKKFFSLFAQVALDFLVGMAVYFGLSAMFPKGNTTVIVATAMVIALIFAEKVEGKFKK